MASNLKIDMEIRIKQEKCDCKNKAKTTQRRTKSRSQTKSVALKKY